MSFRVTSVALAAFALATCGAVQGVPPGRTVDLTVQFKLTDLDYAPIASAPVRVVFGSEAGWQSATAGHRFVTDANGAAAFSARVVIDKQPRKMPTNFADSVVEREQVTDHLKVAAELEYMTHRWLYAVDVCRFPSGGDVMLDRFAVYTPDADGNYTREAKEDEGGWHMADLGGLVLTAPGHQPWDYLLEPDPADASGGQWRLKIAFKRSPAPVRR